MRISIGRLQFSTGAIHFPRWRHPVQTPRRAHQEPSRLTSIAANWRLKSNSNQQPPIKVMAAFDTRFVDIASTQATVRLRIKSLVLGGTFGPLQDRYRCLAERHRRTEAALNPGSPAAPSGSLIRRPAQSVASMATTHGGGLSASNVVCSCSHSATSRCAPCSASTESKINAMSASRTAVLRFAMVRG